MAKKDKQIALRNKIFGIRYNKAKTYGFLPSTLMNSD